MPRISRKKLVEAYKKKAGNISATCTALNISRTTFYSRMDKDDTLAEQISDVNESLLDLSESKLVQAVNEGNMTAIIFHLKTKGKSRGYYEKTETTNRNINVEDEKIKKMTDAELDAAIKEMENGKKR